jgi:hypothetical protein
LASPGPLLLLLLFLLKHHWLLLFDAVLNHLPPQACCWLQQSHHLLFQLDWLLLGVWPAAPCTKKPQRKFSNNYSNGTRSHTTSHGSAIHQASCHIRFGPFQAAEQDFAILLKDQ